MAIKNDLKCSYDEVCVYATIYVNFTLLTKCVLGLINFVLIALIVLSSVEGIIVAAPAFLAFELFVIKCTLWNLFDEERLIINVKSLSYQQHYGFFTGSLNTIVLNRKILIRAYGEIVENEQKTVKFEIATYNENNIPRSNLLFRPKYC